MSPLSTLRASLALVLIGILPHASSAARAIERNAAGRPQNAVQMHALRQTMGRFFPLAASKRIYAVPEYRMDLSEAVMSVDLDTADADNPLFLHEPVLRALPSYSKVFLFAPSSLMAKIRERLLVLGLADRVRLLLKQNDSARPHGGLTRWVRDTMLVARDNDGPVLLTSLAHKDYQAIADNDLEYLDRLDNANRDLVRLPVFLNGGNALVVAQAGRKILLLGSEELRLNRQWMAQAFGLEMAAHDVVDVLKRATQVEEVVILPNSQHLFHLDMAIAPLKNGTVGVLDPADAKAVEQVDREVLSGIREALVSRGFRVIDIPTSAQWIKDYKSPANAVPYTDRRTGRKAVLVPQFPEPANQDRAHSLNLKVLAAYRSAGVEPIPVEDRFHLRFGSIHCALVPLR